MVVGVVTHEMAVVVDSTGRRGIGLGPAALDEERRADVGRSERVEQALGVAAVGRPIGMLGIEGQRDPETVYFSTPVMTIPRVKNRWNMRNRMIGMIIVMIVPAWMYAGLR